MIPVQRNDSIPKSSDGTRTGDGETFLQLSDGSRPQPGTDDFAGHRGSVSPAGNPGWNIVSISLPPP